MDIGFDKEAILIHKEKHIYFHTDTSGGARNPGHGAEAPPPPRGGGGRRVVGK